MKNIKWMPVLMTITILGIAVFQIFWLKNTYEREKRTLEIRSNITFRDAVHSLQATKIDFDKWAADSLAAKAFLTDGKAGKKRKKGESNQGHKMLGLMELIREKATDSSSGILASFAVPQQMTDSLKLHRFSSRHQRLIQFMYEMDSLQDTLKVAEIETLLAKGLEQQNIDVPFSIDRVNKTDNGKRVHNEVTVGFSNPVTYKLRLGNTVPYLMKRISAAIILSIFIVGFTAFSFSLMYGNLLRQRKLGELKNDFISNITHELKTPIATVSVAIEALRSFNANIDPERSKEYLDISYNELQRLSLLVDKVLKLSMFESKEIDLKYEPLCMMDLIEEVTSSMRLQFEKYGAEVTVNNEGNTTLQGDRLHLVSVIFNLMDNALKYSNSSPQINVTAGGDAENIQLVISDNGIGIPREYQDKVFEKFFRVPTGNLHNAKGYGLGLSYVSQVIEKHKGSIQLESVEGQGSRFIITLPKQTA